MQDPTALPGSAVTINRLQVLLGSVACLPSYPTGRRCLLYSPILQPTQGAMRSLSGCLCGFTYVSVDVFFFFNNIAEVVNAF